MKNLSPVKMKKKKKSKIVSSSNLTNSIYCFLVFKILNTSVLDSQISFIRFFGILFDP